MRKIKLAIAALGIAASLTAGLAAPAQALTTPTTNPLPPINSWALTFTHLGPFKTGANLTTIGQRNGIDYRSIVQDVLTNAKKRTGAYCDTTPIQMPLSDEGKNQVGAVTWNPGAHVAVIVNLPCASKRVASLAVYEQRYHPYTRATAGFIISLDGGKVPTDLGCALPHTRQIICLHSTLDQVKHAYPGRYIDSAAGQGTGRVDIVEVFPTHQALLHRHARATPRITLYLQNKSVLSLQLGTPEKG